MPKSQAARQPGRKSHGPEFTVAYISKWVRITSNFFAGAMIVGTAIIIGFLLWKGMFQSQYVMSYPQSAPDSEWQDFHQACVLDERGWVSNTCDAAEVALTGAIPWASLGRQLAGSLLLATNHSTALVTSCLVGMDRSRVAVILLASNRTDGYASCHPKGGQPIMGMFVLETATTSEYPNGAYLLSSWSDYQHYPLSVMIQTDLTPVPIVPFTKSFVDTNGAVAAASNETVNYYTQVNSLNRRYLMWATSNVHIVAILDTTGWDGWSYGKFSNYAGTIGWVQKHSVDNHYELLYFQIAITFLSLAVLANDAYVTFQGASGLLKNKPVLTYDIFSGLERRKMLICALVATMCYSPLYADVLRYLYNMNGFGDTYWSLSLEMIAAMFAFSWIAFLSCWQHLPVPKFLRHRPLSYSGPIFVYMSLFIFLVIATARRRGRLEAAAFWTDAEALLTLNVNGTPVLAGSYTAEGTLPVVNKLMIDVVITNFGAWGIAILANKLMLGYVYLDTKWTEKNEFLKMLDTPVPQWVTCMDLDVKNAIIIGDKLYCKPSMLALLGFCTVLVKNKYSAGVVVVPSSARSILGSARKGDSSNTRKTDNSSARKGDSDDTRGSVRMETAKRGPPQPFLVISIYDLLPAIAKPTMSPWAYIPRVLGTIEHNTFVPAKSATRLEKNLTYGYSRGDCCG
ncbi:hypothetical protein ACHHYP_04363 [Achlya hypogyna]|uniref:Transmembrane protein n=1 Tax=Achlya hypogyna TaxID=1202772 RepID=A0A1V9Z1L6_ACHHY|nr:hypothetical protein ACHHYP_04363 [Achlya hypogyna]